MIKKILAVLIVLFFIGFASANSVYNNNGFNYKEKLSVTKYFPEDNLVLSKTSYANYDNDKRYSTYDYRDGYSYRDTLDYWDNQYFNKKVYLDYDSKNHRGERTSHWDHNYHDNEYYYSKYIPYLGSYKKIGCYHHAPRDKLFYVKCP